MKTITEESDVSTERSRSQSLYRQAIANNQNERSSLLEHRRRERRWQNSFGGSTSGSGHQKCPQVRHIDRTITVEPVVVLFYVSFNASVPIMQQFVYDRYLQEYNASEDNTTATCGVQNTSDPFFLAQQQAQAASSKFMVGLSLCCVLPALVSTLLLGPYSDQAGRKIAMLPSLAGEVVRLSTNAATIYFKLPLWVMFFSFFLSGVLGSAGSVLMACFSYLSDITTHKQRSFRILLLEVCMGLGITASQIGIGHMIESLGFFWPMFTIAILNLCNLIYAMFFLPECRDRVPEARLFCMERIKKPFMLYIINDWKERRWKLQMCLLTFAVVTIVDLGSNEVTTLYLLNTPLCWGPILVGYFNGISYMIKNVGALLLIKLFYRAVGDIGLVIIGIVSVMAFELTLSQATNALIAYMAPVAALGMTLVLPMVRSIASKLVEPEEQGSLFATQGWMQLFAACVGSFFFNTIYAQTLFLMHGFVFLIAAALMIIPLISAIIVGVVTRKESQEHEAFEERRAMMSTYLDRKCSMRSGSFIA